MKKHTDVSKGVVRGLKPGCAGAPLMEPMALRPTALAALLVAGVLGAGVLASMPAHAQQAAAVEAARQAFQYPSQPLLDALRAFGGQTQYQVLFDDALVQGRQAPAITGSFTPREALERLLAGSGLVGVSTQPGTITLRKAPQAAAAAADTVLAPVVVTAQAERGVATEGTGSYTTHSTRSATGLGLSLRETPQSVSVITRQRMEDQGLTQLADVVAQTAGLVVSQNGNVGSDSSPIYSRGFSVDNYLIDGVKMLESYTSIFQSQDMALYDRVEIVRGATGLMNGSGSPSASINMVRKKPTKDFQASARLELGSWDYRRADVDISTPLNESGSVRGRLVAAVQDAGSYIDRLEEDRTVLYGVVEADLDAGTLVRAGLSQQRHDSTGHARGGLPAFYSDGTRTKWARSDSAAPTWAYSKRHSTSGFVELEHLFDNGWELKASAMRTLTDSDELVGYASSGNPDRVTGAGVGIWATHWLYQPHQNVVNVNANGQFDLFGREHDLALGVTHARTRRNGPHFTNWYHDGWSNAISNIFTWDGTDPAAPENPTVGSGTMNERSNSVFASTRLHATDALSVILGARYTDWQRAESTHSLKTGSTSSSLSKASGEITPYAGLVFDFSEHWSAYASYTTIFQPQSYKTITGRYIDPLSGNSTEVGIKGAFFDNRLNIGAAVYETEEDNKAIAIPDTFAPDGAQAYYATSGTKSRGFEVEVAGQVAPGWELSASFARNVTRDRLGTLINTTVPKNTAKLYTSYQLDALARGLVVGGGLRWQNEIYANNMGPNRVRLVQPAYTVVDLMARYPVSEKTTISVNLNNVFDKEYLTNAGNSYYGAPRSLRVALDTKF